MKYGVGYVGSKNTIAADIINALPSGNRLIDLFGGGGAITHCATLSNKYNTVVYNDYDQPVVEAIINAILLEFADIIWSKTKNVLINKDTNSKKKLECLYKIKR